MERGTATTAWKQALAELRAEVRALDEPARSTWLNTLNRLALVLDARTNPAIAHEPRTNHARTEGRAPSRLVGLSVPDHVPSQVQPRELPRAKGNGPGRPAAESAEAAQREALELFRAAWLEHHGLFGRFPAIGPRQLEHLAEVRAWAGEKYGAVVKAFFSPRCPAHFKQLKVFLNQAWLQECGNIAGLGMNFPAWRKRQALAAAEKARLERNTITALEDAANEGRPKGQARLGDCLPFELQ